MLLPTLKRAAQESVTDYGPEKSLCGRFEGTVAEFQVFARNQGVNVVFALGSDEKPEAVIRCDWPFPVDAGTALAGVAVQFKKRYPVIRRDAVTYLVGDLAEADTKSRVYWVTGQDCKEFLEMLKAVGSGSAKVAGFGDTVVVRDSVEGLRAVDAIYAQLMGARGQYVVEVRFVELSESGARSLGIDWGLAGSVRLGVKASLSSTVDRVLSGTAMLESEVLGLLSATESRNGVRLVQMSRVHVIEGLDAHVVVGETVPVPNRTVSGEGTVSTSGYTEIQTGFDVKVSVRSEPGGTGLLRVLCSPELSSITRYVGESPVRSRRAVQSAAVVEPGGVFVLGGFDATRAERATKGLPGVQSWWKSGDEGSRMFIVVRVVPAVSSPVEVVLPAGRAGGPVGGDCREGRIIQEMQDEDLPVVVKSGPASRPTAEIMPVGPAR